MDSDHATPSAGSSSFRTTRSSEHEAVPVSITTLSTSRDITGTKLHQSVVSFARPKSAGVLNRKVMLTSNNQSEDTSVKTTQREASPSARVLKATFSSPRVGIHHKDQFCTKFKSPRLLGPRPPPASSVLVSSNNSGRPNRYRNTDLHTTSSNNISSSTANLHVGTISQRVMKEEIETQRRVTRQAQRHFHALQHTFVERVKELELVKRHLSAFEAQTNLMASSSTSPSKLSSTSTTSTSPSTNSSVIAVLAAGAQNGGAGARHRESIAAAAGLSEIQAASSSSTATAVPAVLIKRLKDQVQRQDLYKKKLRQLLDRLSRHVHFLHANLETLRIKQESTKREFLFFQTKLVHERNHCTELEHKRHELINSQATHAHNAMLVLDSLREEITSRSMMSRHRYEADRRREELLTLVQTGPAARPGSSRTMSTDRGAASANRKISLRVLSADKSSTDFAPILFFADMAASRRSPTPTGTAPATSASSPRCRSNSVDLQQLVQREAFMQIYEGQYARVLEETGESDLSVVIERFVSFKETKRHLLQIESEVSEQNMQLEREREAHSDLVRKLRVSGIAEVEKRKKIRDFLEQMHHVKAQVKDQAKDKFLEQLKTFLYVQQGVGNIVELFKCLDDRILAPPPTESTLSSPLAGGSSPVSVAHLLVTIVHFCVQVIRSNPSGVPIVFTADQVEKLRVFVSDHLDPHFRKPKRRSRLMNTIDSSLVGWKAPVRGATSPVSSSTVEASAQSFLSTLLKVKRRRSSVEKDASGRKPSFNQLVPRTGGDVRAPATRVKVGTPHSKVDKQPQSGTERGQAEGDSEEDDEDDEDDDAQVSSESDAEDARRDIKRSEKDTLQQVEALLKTFDAKQSMSQDAQQPIAAAVKLKHRLSGAGRHGNLHLMPVRKGNLDPDAAHDTHQELGELMAMAGTVCDKSARLDAVHAFFREKRRCEHQEQQQQREVLALLAEASYSTRSATGNSINHHNTETGAGYARIQATVQHGGIASSSTGGTGQGGKAGGPGRSKVAASLIARKRSNGIVALALHSVTQQQQQQVQAQATIAQSSSANLVRKPLHPKTVR